MSATKQSPPTSLKDHFLLATPELHGTPFADAVIYLCEHNEDGAMGLIVNHPLDIPLSEIFEQFHLNYSEHIGRHPVFSGGPVQIERGFVLHRPDKKSWEATQAITSTISLTSSRDIIVDMASEAGPRDALIILGYAGWGAGQLEAELTTNAWLTAPASSEVLFDTPYEARADVAAAKIGVDLKKLSRTTGHA